MQRYFREPQERTWKCGKCGEDVPATMEICWNCGTSQDGVEDPNFVKADTIVPPEVAAEEADGDELHDDPVAVRRTAESRTELRCPRCGSTKVLPNVQTLVEIAHNTPLRLLVDRKPDAFILKDRLFGELTADVCGECGHVELRVSNGPELYEHYRKSLE